MQCLRRKRKVRPLYFLSTIEIPMRCPLCTTQLKIGEDRIIKCGRFHRFYLKMDDDGCRFLELCVDPKDGGQSAVGDRFPVIDNDEAFS